MGPRVELRTGSGLRIKDGGTIRTRDKSEIRWDHAGFESRVGCESLSGTSGWKSQSGIERVTLSSIRGGLSRRVM